MDRVRRDECIDAYYRGLDAPDYDLVTSAFADDVAYQYPGEGTLRGVDAVRAFFEDRRPTSETTHDVFRRVHGDDCTVCEGAFTGAVDGEGVVEGTFVGVFEFDDEADAIASISVYARW